MAKSDKENLPLDTSHYVKLDDKINGALLDSRRLFLSDAVDNESANEIIKKLWYLELTNPGKPILFIINSPGGSVDSGFAIWDQIKMITSPVTTLVTGLAASMGSILSLCAAPGRRFATKNSRIMIHQPFGGVGGTSEDIALQAREILELKKITATLMARFTGQSMERVTEDSERDYYMNPETALKYGIVDHIAKPAHLNSAAEQRTAELHASV